MQGTFSVQDKCKYFWKRNIDWRESLVWSSSRHQDNMAGKCQPTEWRLQKHGLIMLHGFIQKAHLKAEQNQGSNKYEQE